MSDAPGQGGVDTAPNPLAMTGLEIMRATIAGTFPPPPMAETIPTVFTRADPGEVDGWARAEARHLNPMGGVHGGFAATVLDSAAGCAALTCLEPGAFYGTTDLTVKLVRPVPMDIDLPLTGRVLSETRRLILVEARLTTPEGKLLAHALASQLVTRAG